MPKGKEVDRVENKGEPQEVASRPKPCCACPETRKLRDECIVEKGEENCKDLIEAHRKCMKQFGYDV
ncbi:Cytochrome c oxidase copper chaperone [Trichuris trichiura]|uniref:Cytochrome c oxidase copper chaperone n=1 Tax=Trichuris trichiura TaxID=36087 RepID=A0A077Z184_TRITR|nr:Cytochrome c oxidase copper chaperone [Trichuris trichiura]